MGVWANMTCDVVATLCLGVSSPVVLSARPTSRPQSSGEQFVQLTLEARNQLRVRGGGVVAYSSVVVGELVRHVLREPASEKLREGQEASMVRRARVFWAGRR